MFRNLVINLTHSRRVILTKEGGLAGEEVINGGLGPVWVVADTDDWKDVDGTRLRRSRPRSCPAGL
jgi:hypothetical protein